MLGVARWLPALVLGLGVACATADRPLAGELDRVVAVTEGLVYARPDGEALRADVHRLPSAGPRPGVLLVHGGAWHAGRREEMHRAAMRLARHGYVAVSVDYRLAPGARYPAPLADLADALAWMRAHAEELALDPESVAVWGYSAGAHLAALLALSQPDLGLRAVVAGGLPADLTRFDNAVVRRFLGVAYDQQPDLWVEASPARRVHPGAPPFFLYHGREDRIVPSSQAHYMAEALEAAGVPHELFSPAGGHIETFLDDAAVTRRVLRFLARWAPPAKRVRVGTADPSEIRYPALRRGEGRSRGGIPE